MRALALLVLLHTPSVFAGPINEPDYGPIADRYCWLMMGTLSCVSW